jgi:hypothetical protein
MKKIITRLTLVLALAVGVASPAIVNNEAPAEASHIQPQASDYCRHYEFRHHTGSGWWANVPAYSEGLLYDSHLHYYYVYHWEYKWGHWRWVYKGTSGTSIQCSGTVSH